MAMTKAPRGPRGVTQGDKEMGQRLRLRRCELNISQASLAIQLGVSFQQVQKYEKGMNRIGAGRLQKIAEVLGVPVTFFYTEKKNKTQNEVESLLFTDAPFTLRLLRAYAQIDLKVQRHFVSLIESIAGVVE